MKDNFSWENFISRETGLPVDCLLLPEKIAAVPATSKCAHLNSLTNW